jgi:diaminohydroxyphosphoribosylaminopyrimidine deaminase/5-amino-6-(5-phosphoribosylamino)uracil reductase
LSELDSTDVAWLDRAAALARPWLGTTADNPTVGAILVDPVSGEEIAHAVTAPGGRPHAETQVIAAAGERARGASLFVTLEPCNYWGRTPPCVDAVIRAGIARVVVGIRDPDPRTGGQGIARLRASGIAVALADHARSARLHEGHVMRYRRGRPFVIAKLVVSSDARIGRRDQPRALDTGEDARYWTHVQRATVDAILVGSGAVLTDNPDLTVRIEGLEDRTPTRVILAGRRRLDRSLTLIGRVSPFPVVVIADEANPPALPPTIDVVLVPGRDGRPMISPAMKALAERGFARVLVEGGALVTERLLGNECVDRFHLLTSEAVIGPKGVRATLLGTIEARLEAAGLDLVDQRMLGPERLSTYERG